MSRYEIEPTRLDHIVVAVDELQAGDLLGGDSIASAATNPLTRRWFGAMVVDVKPARDPDDGTQIVTIERSRAFIAHGDLLVSILRPSWD